MSKKTKSEISREEAKRRIQDSAITLPPTLDQTLAGAVDQLGERDRLRVLAHVSHDEAAILAIGIAWNDYLNNREKSFVENLFENLSTYSRARSGIAAKQLTSIAQAHAGGGKEEKESRWNRFWKAVGVKSD